jgi:preprotein translocase subunit SecD
MDRGWYVRLSILVLLCSVAVYVLYPSYYFYVKATPEQRDSHEKFCAALPKYMACSKLNLGLDLQGGVHLVMGVRVEKALEHRVDRAVEAMRARLQEKGVVVGSVVRGRGSVQAQVTLLETTSQEAFQKILREDFAYLQVVSKEGLLWKVALTEEEAEASREWAVEQAIKTIRNRADKLGVTEPTIARRGKDSVMIQLPGVKDPERAIDIIGRTAQLEFKMVDAEGTSVFDGVQDAELPEGVKKREYTFDGPKGAAVREVYFELPEDKVEALRAFLEPRISSEREIGFGMPGEVSAAEPKLLRSYLLHTQAGITGDYLTQAQVQQNPDMPNDYYVTMTFDAVGAKMFETLTEQNQQRHMAIVLDGRVSSAPMIQEKIGGGTARITLGGMGDARKRFEEAKDLALVLKAGAMPAPVEIREKRQVGRTLGQDTVHKGSVAMLVGTVLVLVFMVLLYKKSGMIANAALVLNTLFLLAMLSLFDATLTLPGMAGIVLTIGMAVDANVIIFERIREELRAGKTPRVAVDAGYEKAFSSIFDSNVTTIIAAVVLMQYGSGPVRGFAVSLALGITCSFYTAIVVTRMVYDMIMSRRRLTTLSI